jgi:hypothetical protein
VQICIFRCWVEHIPTEVQIPQWFAAPRRKHQIIRRSHQPPGHDLVIDLKGARQNKVLTDSRLGQQDASDKGPLAVPLGKSPKSPRSCFINGTPSSGHAEACRCGADLYNAVQRQRGTCGPCFVNQDRT